MATISEKLFSGGNVQRAAEDGLPWAEEESEEAREEEWRKGKGNKAGRECCSMPRPHRQNALGIRFSEKHKRVDSATEYFGIDFGIYILDKPSHKV